MGGADRVRDALGALGIHVLEAEGAEGTAAVARALIRSARRGDTCIWAWAASALALPQICQGMKHLPRRCALLHRVQPAVQRTLALSRPHGRTPLRHHSCLLVSAATAPAA